MSDTVNFALALARVWLGIVIFAHGWRHVKALSGPGMANWMESIGLRPGPLHAQMMSWTEVAAGPALVLGLLTPAAYGGLAALMIVAIVTNHRAAGFFVNNRPTEGWEYVATVAVVSLALGALGPGEWSLDDAFGLAFPFKPGTALAVAAIVGIGGAVGYLATFWRPVAKQPPS